jgi:hypothetical protein
MDDKTKEMAEGFAIGTVSLREFVKHLRTVSETETDEAVDWFSHTLYQIIAERTRPKEDANGRTDEDAG